MLPASSSWLIIVLAAILAPLIAPYAPSKLSIVNRLQAAELDHLFGTDDFGRDVFTRMLYAGAPRSASALPWSSSPSIIGIIARA